MCKTTFSTISNNLRNHFDRYLVPLQNIFMSCFDLINNQISYNQLSNDSSVHDTSQRVRPGSGPCQTGKTDNDDTRAVDGKVEKEKQNPHRDVTVFSICV